MTRGRPLTFELVQVAKVSWFVTKLGGLLERWSLSILTINRGSTKRCRLRTFPESVEETSKKSGSGDEALSSSVSVKGRT